MIKNQNPTDGFLILKYKEGDPSVLPTLVKRYHKMFCERAYWLTKDKEVAKDIAQDSWVTIINKLETLEKVESFKSWALRILYTKAIDGLKHKKKERENLQSISLSTVDEGSSQEEKDRIHKTLLSAIKKLPKDKQDIIRLFYAEGYSINEISAFLKTPVGTTKSRLFKAREKLKSTIKKVHHEK